MRYQTPQFIDIEDKIFGPLSWKQFLYIAGGAGIGYVLYALLPIFLAIPLIILIGGFALALAFYKVNNRPLVFLIQAMFTYAFRTKFYLWRKVPKKETSSEKKTESTQEEILEPKMTESRLKKLAWSLDVLDMEDTSRK